MKLKKLKYQEALYSKGCNLSSRHLYGDAIDFTFPGCFGAFWKEIEATWQGGYCNYNGGWIHLDVRGYRQTWPGG